MAEWLRPVFGRARTPVLSDRQSCFSVDESEASEFHHASRASSFVGLRSGTPPISQLRLRDPESVYEPSVHHMAETLKVVMMNQNTMDPIPTGYNATVLHVLEAYQDMRTELAKNEDEMQEMKLFHTKDIKDFEDLATRWELKEKDYKIELKKLEVLLSKTEGGLEKVALARSKSLVHGSGVAETIGRGISTIKERNAARDSRAREHSIGTESPFEDKTALSNTKAKHSFFPRINLKPLMGPQAAHNSPGALAKRPATPFRASVQPSPESIIKEPTPERLPSPTKSKLDALESEVDSGMAFDSSASGPGSSNHSIRDKMPREKRFGLGIEIDEEMSLQYTTSDTQTQKPEPLLDFHNSGSPEFDTGSESLETSPALGFSFKPGDDVEMLAPEAANDSSMKELVRAKRYKVHPNGSGDQSETFHTVLQTPEARAKTTPLAQRPKVKNKQSSAASSYVTKDTQDTESLQRDDSSSSLITAVRDNSGRSSRHSSQGGVRKGLNRSSGSNEAVTAAIRALAGTPVSARGTAHQRKNGSGSGSNSVRGSPMIEEGNEASSKQSRKSSSVASSVSNIGSPIEHASKQDRREWKT